ncbi:MAG: homoserine O-succinyltransferase [Eubacteriales bacterium]|nr:homoserine O-succinyltransferase [Eubacteriales bacterium]
MPILVPKGLPAYNILRDEGVFVMTRVRGSVQDIRPLKIVIVNLMPTKEVTETQLIRMLANTPLQVELYLLTMDTDQHIKDADKPHMHLFYQTYQQIRNQKFDGMIITGAPLEKLDFDEVDYWDEFKDLMDYTKQNVFSTIHICWGAQAALFHHYGIPKHILDEKLFGVFPHRILKPSVFTRGFDDIFYVPHSRHSQIYSDDIRNVDELNIIAESEQAGPHLTVTDNNRWLFVQGHWEYDRDTLRAEYSRDRARGLADVKVPFNYFIDDDPDKPVNMSWRGHANLFYTNWLNYVYQNTPFDLEELENLDWSVEHE